jgi:hypothetical protein
MYSIDLFERLVIRHASLLSGPAYRSAQMYHLSFINCLQEPTIFLAHFARLLKSPGPLFFQTSEVALDVPDVELKVASDEIGIFPCGLRITRNERPRRWVAGCRDGKSGQNHKQKYSRCVSGSLQPEGAKTPTKLDQTQRSCLTFV